MFKSNLDSIIERYQKEGYLVVPIRAAHGHAINDYLAELDKDAYREEYYQIIATGGDGTINICVNAMIRNNIDLPLAIMPAGTANDFAYYFDIPNDIDKMLDIALSGNYTYADVGKVNDRHFINVAAIGQVVDVSQKTDPALKNTIGSDGLLSEGTFGSTEFKTCKGYIDNTGTGLQRKKCILWL